MISDHLVHLLVCNSVLGQTSSILLPDLLQIPDKLQCLHYNVCLKSEHPLGQQDV